MFVCVYACIFVYVFVCVVVVVAKSLGIYHGFSPFMSLVSNFGILVTVRALAEYWQSIVYVIVYVYVGVCVCK